jgi:hypothetical protein
MPVKPLHKYHYRVVVPYRPALDVRNTDHLPRGTGARYLLCVRGVEPGVLIAKAWCRRMPTTWGYDDVLIDFHKNKQDV